MSINKTKGYRKWDKSGTTVRQTGRTGHSLESCPTVPMSAETRLVIEAHDLVSREMELKWGVDRLHKLVPGELGAKFLAQRDKFNQAIHFNNEADIKKHGAGMKRAYQMLDDEAEKAGAPHVGREFWELRHPSADDLIIRLVRTQEEMPTDQPEGVAYLSADELIEFVPRTVIEIKRTFAGSRVTDMKRKDTTPDDPIPF